MDSVESFLLVEDGEGHLSGLCEQLSGKKWTFESEIAPLSGLPVHVCL